MQELWGPVVVPSGPRTPADVAPPRPRTPAAPAPPDDAARSAPAQTARSAAPQGAGPDVPADQTGEDAAVAPPARSPEEQERLAEALARFPEQPTARRERRRRSGLLLVAVVGVLVLGVLGLLGAALTVPGLGAGDAPATDGPSTTVDLPGLPADPSLPQGGGDLPQVPPAVGGGAAVPGPGPAGGGPPVPGGATVPQDLPGVPLDPGTGPVGAAR